MKTADKIQGQIGQIQNNLSQTQKQGHDSLDQQSQKVTDQIQSSIRSFSNDVTSSYNQILKSLDPQILFVKQGLKSYFEFQSCLCKQYNKLPQQITDYKKSQILPFGSQNTRLILLGFSSLTSVLLLRKFKPVGPLITIRNLFIAYHAFGLLIVPEIYNPYINWGYACHLEEVRFKPSQ